MTRQVCGIGLILLALQAAPAFAQAVTCPGAVDFFLKNYGFKGLNEELQALPKGGVVPGQILDFKREDKLKGFTFEFQASPSGAEAGSFVTPTNATFAYGQGESFVVVTVFGPNQSGLEHRIRFLPNCHTAHTEMTAWEGLNKQEGVFDVNREDCAKLNFQLNDFCQLRKQSWYFTNAVACNSSDFKFVDRGTCKDGDQEQPQQGQPQQP